jgi:hypothetical protein
MLDCVNAPEILWSNHPVLCSGFNVEEVHVYHNLAVIKKGSAKAVSNVLAKQLRHEWLALDMNQHGIDERIADLLCNPLCQES